MTFWPHPLWIINWQKFSQLPRTQRYVREYFCELLAGIFLSACLVWPFNIWVIIVLRYMYYPENVGRKSHSQAWTGNEAYIFISWLEMCQRCTARVSPEFSTLVATGRKMILLAVLFWCLVAVQATGKIVSYVWGGRYVCVAQVVNEVALNYPISESSST